MKNIKLFVFFVFCLGNGLAYAESEKKVDITLSCPITGHYLDGEIIKNKGEEERIVIPQADNAARANITSNEKKFEANVISHSSDYLIVAYGNMLKEGLSTNLIVASYMIDLQTKKFRRILSFFPNGKVWSLEGQCRQM